MTMTRRLIRFLVPAAFVLAAAPLSAQHRNASRSRSGDGDESRIDTVVSVGRGVTVDLSLLSGEIKVTSWDKPQVQVKAHSDEGDLRFDASSQRVSLSVDEDSDEGGDTEFEIIVPRDARVTAGTVSGDVSVRGVGELEGSSVSGDVTGAGVAGRTSLQSVSGEVNGSDLGGPVKARAVSGDVTLSGIAGDVSVETVSGEMKLRGVKSSYVRTSTVAGDLEFEGTLDPKGRYEFHSHSGDFTITLPRGAGAQVSMKGFSGELHSSCEMMLLPGSQGEGHYKGMSFMIGQGGAHVSVETFSGDVEIKGCGKSKSKEE
jgi:DUF4097 and DUF4098 domain-containing protein YvlB